MSAIANVIPLLVPTVVVGLWIFVLQDWHNHCVYRRQYWLVVLLATNLIGYYFFLHSTDRQ